MLATASAGRCTGRGIGPAGRQRLKPLLGVVRAGGSLRLLGGEPCLVLGRELYRVEWWCSEPQRDDPLALQPLTCRGLLLDDRALRELARDRLDGGDEPGRADDRHRLRAIDGCHIGCYPLPARHRRDGHAGVQESGLRRCEGIKNTGGR